MFWTLLLYMFISRISPSETACSGTLPLSAGTWKTSNRGTWTVDSAQTTISNFEYTTNAATGPTKINMKCEDDTTDTDGYILLKSTTTRNLFGGLKYIYACMKFEPQTTSTTNAYYFYMSAVETTLSTGTYERIILLPTSVTTFDFSRLCNEKSTTPDRTHVAIKDGTETNAAITCPTSILGTFSYSDTLCTTTFLDVCTVRSEFNYNYTVCATAQMFSAGGQFYCVHSGSNDGNDYVTLYNRDTTVDSSTYFRFVCMVYSTADTIVTASINPKECFSSARQTPTSTLHTKGLTRTFTNYADSECYSFEICTGKSNRDVKTSTTTDLTWLYVLIAIIIILIIIAIIVAIWYFKCRKKEKKQDDEESLHVSDVEPEDKKIEETKPIEETKREPTPEPPPKEEEDTKSIDSGIQQDKKEEVKKQEKKVEIEEIEEKKEIKTEEPKNEEEVVKESSESETESEDTDMSSRVTTPEDPEEIQRKIRQIGMKKTTTFKPTGELNTVLVSRQMQEKNLINNEKGKWKKMKNLFRGKTKKVKDSGQEKTKEQERDKSAKRISSPRKEKDLLTERAVTPFMNQYNYKKKMEDMLEEKHTWGKAPDYSTRFKDSDDEEFEEILKEINDPETDKKKEKAKVHYEDENKNEDRKRRKSASQDKVKISKAEKERRRLRHENEAKDSGVDSPDLKKEAIEMSDIDPKDLPPGYIRDSAGQIIRSYDGKVMSKDEMQSIFQLAKLGQLFHVPRLKRTAQGRPTGEFVEDEFGPPIEKEDEEEKSADDDSLGDDYYKPKRQKSAVTNRTSSRKDQRDHKTVAFDITDSQSDVTGKDDDDDDEPPRKDDLTSKDRELLKSRLFKGKRKPGSRGTLDERPRELNDLVKVIPQGSAKKYAISGRAPDRSRSEAYDPEQQRRYREGLAADKRILEKSPGVKRRAPGNPTEAFVDQDTEDIRLSVGSPEHRQQGVNIGNDDEFFLVGNLPEQQERLFTQVRRPGQTTVRPLPNTHDWFCPKHDMRHALPWSLINQYQIRESSILDANSIAKKHTAPKSADNAKKKMDDRRLKELLEELYKDKKYFDHVIDSTEPNIEPIIDERDLASHGREFLMERAEYWDDRGVALQRPPTTALGYRMSRMNTQISNFNNNVHAPENGRRSTVSVATPTPNGLDSHRSTSSVSAHNKSQKRKELPQAFLKREHTIA